MLKPESVVMPTPLALAGLRDRLRSAIQGKEDVIENVLACLLARGHLLLEDLPGLGKTTLAKALADGIGGTFARVQCTPDLLPGDITGFNVFNQKTREFDFLPGPVFADVLLADEVNRATPRAQSALFEAMAERQATVDNVRRPLSDLFLVIATQNPVEHHGTYPLPEAQLDRFAMKLRIGYPNRGTEIKLLQEAVRPHERNGRTKEPVLTPDQLRLLQDAVASLHVAPTLMEYVVDLGRATRAHPEASLGLSPRGLLVWQRVAQARAFLSGRDFVTADDIQQAAGPVLEVRLGVRPEAFKSVLEEILETTPVPVSIEGSR